MPASTTNTGPQDVGAPELVALLTTLDATDPAALTSCPGWTAHHIAAHIAGNYEEVRLHVEAFAHGEPLTRTRSWEEREATLRTLDDAALRHRIEVDARRVETAIAELARTQPNAELRWTGRVVPVSGFLTHMRSEDALHRWDIVGDDDTSRDLLGQQKLLEHAVGFIGRPLSQRGLAAGAATGPFAARVRCAGRDDLVVDVRAGEATLSVRPPIGDAVIETDPAARLLVLWGRKPTPFSRLRAGRDEDEAGRMQLLLAGY